MALATLAGAALMAVYSLRYAVPSSITLLGNSAAADAVPLSSLAGYVAMAAVMAAVNFAVQGLHHHDRWGVEADPGRPRQICVDLDISVYLNRYV